VRLGQKDCQRAAAEQRHPPPAAVFVIDRHFIRRRPHERIHLAASSPPPSAAGGSPRITSTSSSPDPTWSIRRSSRTGEGRRTPSSVSLPCSPASSTLAVPCRWIARSRACREVSSCPETDGVCVMTLRGRDYIFSMGLGDATGVDRAGFARSTNRVTFARSSSLAAATKNCSCISRSASVSGAPSWCWSSSAPVCTSVRFVRVSRCPPAAPGTGAALRRTSSPAAAAPRSPDGTPVARLAQARERILGGVSAPPARRCPPSIRSC